jgi:branched-chain amino acid transport system substrate-binding protein
MAAFGMVRAAALVLSACGSDDEASGGNGGPGGGGGGGGSMDIGLLTSLSGPVATAAPGAIRGAQARLDAYADSDGACSDVDVNLVQARPRSAGSPT